MCRSTRGKGRVSRIPTWVFFVPVLRGTTDYRTLLEIAYWFSRG
jgi:hypothetical protein